MPSSIGSTLCLSAAQAVKAPDYACYRPTLVEDRKLVANFAGVLK